MIKKMLLIFTLIFFVACSSSIVLKKEKVESPPLKIKEGEYSINLYRIEYPRTIKEKQIFMREFYFFLQKMIIYNDVSENKKRYSFLFEEDFFDDLEDIKTKGSFQEEEIFLKTASSLSEEELINIKKLYGKRKYKNDLTVQDILNIQVERLLIINRKKDMYIKEKIYTELDKEHIANEIKKERKKIKELLEKVEIEFVMEIENPYEKKEIEKSTYYYEKDIKLNKESGVFETLSANKYPLYFKELKEKDIQKLLNKVINFKQETLIVSQKKKIGYLHFNNNFVFFEGGKEDIRDYDKYKIEIRIENIGLEEVIEKEEINTISDITGG